MPGTRRRSKAWPNCVVWQPGRDDKKAANYQTVEDIFIAIGRLLGRTKPRYVWRGHRDIDWELTPTLHRKLARSDGVKTVGDPDVDLWVAREQAALLDRARASGYGMAAGGDRESSQTSGSELRQLALLQHHGAATALLDVTADPFVAPYFAALTAEQSTDGALIAIDATTSVRGGRRHAVEYDLTTDRRFDELVGELKQNDRSSFGLYRPPRFSPRIAVQRSHFIFSESTSAESGSVKLGDLPSISDAEARLARIFDGQRTGGHTATLPVTVIKISKAIKVDLLDHLRANMGVSHETLFPDLDGFARSRGPSSAPLTMPPSMLASVASSSGMGIGVLGVGSVSA